MANASDRWNGQPRTSDEIMAIISQKPFRIGYQAQQAGIDFNPDLFPSEHDQCRYEEGRQMAATLQTEGLCIEWRLDRTDPPMALLAAIR